MLSVYEVAERISDYYAKDGNCVGGSLHIVTDDGNTEGHHVLFCLRWAEKHNDPDGIALAEALIDLDTAERDRAIEMSARHRYHGVPIR